MLAYDRPERLSMTHYSPLSGAGDVPESYHTLVYTLTEVDGGTRLDLEQDGCTSEEQAEQFSTNWQGYLDGLQRVAEAEAQTDARQG